MTAPKHRDAGGRTHEERVSDLERRIETLAPRPAQGGTAARAAIRRATRLAGMVRDEGPDGLGAYLDELDREQLYAITVTLAAMVDVDSTVEDLLGWLVPYGEELEREAQRTRSRSAA